MSYHRPHHDHGRIPDLVDLRAAAAYNTADEVVGDLHLVDVMLNEPSRCARVGTATDSRSGIATNA